MSTPFEAALVTRDRALQARSESLDVLKRLLEEMDNNDLAKTLKERLDLILENPSLITDEVFNNIMSRTAEVMDVTYDQEVSDVLNAARSQGISGAALQVRLDRAKQAKAQALAGAYRDALIQRAAEGRTNELAVIQQTQNFLSNFFEQKRLLTEDLVNVLNTIVPEPFENPGPPATAQAPAGGGGGGGFRPIMGDYTPSNPLGQDLAVERQRLEQERELLRQMAQANDDPSQRPLAIEERLRREQEARLRELAQQQKSQSSQDQLIEAAARREAGLPVLNPGEGYITDSQGNTIASNSDLQSRLQAQGQQSLQDAGFGALSPATEDTTQQALNGQISKFSQVRTTPSGTQFQLAFDPKTFALPAGSTVTTQGAEGFRGGQEATINIPGQQGISFGGGAQEAARVARDLIPNFGLENVIGTSEGAGVRKGFTPAHSGGQTASIVGKTDSGMNIYEFRRADGSVIGRATGNSLVQGSGFTLQDGTEDRSQTPTERRRARRLIEQYGEDRVIRTSSGYGVRK